MNTREVIHTDGNPAVAEIGLSASGESKQIKTLPSRYTRASLRVRHDYPTHQESDILKVAGAEGATFWTQDTCGRGIHADGEPAVVEMRLSASDENRQVRALVPLGRKEA